MDPVSQLAARLSAASRNKAWDVYSAIDWPAALDADYWCMSPELVSLHGTEMFAELDEAQQRRLAFYEVVNFFSITLQGERPLVQGLSDRLYAPGNSEEVTDYLHHFLDEENRHMVMFGSFCRRYAGKVYPDKKLALPRKYAPGEKEVAIYVRAMVVEELGDYFNVRLERDDRVEPLVREINRLHHRDEARHLAFGRLQLADVWRRHTPGWSAETVQSFQKWLQDYLVSSWADFYNPSMYRDAGLEDAYAVRQRALSHPACRANRERASEKLIDYFVETGILDEAPAL